ncbi:MAG: hypothetical protein N3A72_00285 [bacterium]|nr:hypothetical protein [bacterium]
MKCNRTIKVLTSVLVVSLFIGVVLVMAQEPPPPPSETQRPGPGGFDPAQFQARMIERSTTNVKLTADEAKVIMPKIEALISYRFSSMQELQPLRQDLRDLLESGKASDKAIKQALDRLKAKAAEIKKKTEELETNLKSVLTIQQEAQLTLNGVITQGLGMGGMGFGGARGGFGGRGNRDSGGGRTRNN